jgi:uncharacterized SAM-binding protein YcdF (DUF218 family)
LKLEHGAVLSLKQRDGGKGDGKTQRQQSMRRPCAVILTDRPEPSRPQRRAQPTMNDLFVRLGLEAWKPLLSALVLPPVPLLLLVLWGAWRLARRRAAGWAAVWLGLVLLWASGTAALGNALINLLTTPPPALAAAERAALAGAPHTAIVVLGAGRKLLAPEYAAADLKPLTLERLRYGLWLARQTRLPLAYSGGLGYGSPPGPSEAAVAGQIAKRDFGQTLRWAEDQSRDTNENARYTVALLHADGIRQIVLVTHDFHQRRALADFERALRASGVAMRLVPAPVGLRPNLGPGWVLGDYLPTAEGFALTQLALHEWLGRLAGA